MVDAGAVKYKRRGTDLATSVSIMMEKKRESADVSAAAVICCCICTAYVHTTSAPPFDNHRI